MARMGSRLWGPWHSYGARTDDIDGTSSFHFLHINLIVLYAALELWILKLPHPTFEKRLIDNHDDRQSCAFRSRAGKLVIILRPQLYPA